VRGEMERHVTERMVFEASQLPPGVTLFFSDIEGSTDLLQYLGDRYSELLMCHHEVMRGAFARYQGQEVDCAGDGFFVAFPTAAQAVRAAVEAQRLLHADPWPGVRLLVRMGLHTGEPKRVGGRYVGLDVHRAARICAAANGGQVLLSSATRERLGESELEGLLLRDVGSHRLKGLRYPEHLFEVLIPELPECTAPIRSLSNRPNNLPLQPTTFIGRKQQVEEVGALLSRPEVRMVTLTGPGGTGKTRLGLEVARTLLHGFPSGVFQVLLAPVTDPALVATTIAQTLGVPELPGKPVLEPLKSSIGASRMLLLLDNFEQVLEAAPMVGELLASCPNLRVLVTSRGTLKLRFEREYAVPPLQLPPMGAPPNTEKLAECESVQLFTNRVRSFKPDFEVTAENAPLLSAICSRLEGLPLAIELAAPRMKMLSLPALLARLSDRLGFLRGGPRDLAQRHQALRAAIDWSYNLLTDSERMLFRRASVFVGGLAIESAEAVCGFEPAMPADVFDGLSSLAEKSLFTRSEVDGEPRLGMLETIQAYAQEQLQRSPDHAPVRARHAAHFLELVEELGPHLLGRQQRQSVGRILTEEDNVRAGLTWALEQPTAEMTSRYLQVLLWFWVPQGLLTEGRGWAERALEQTRTLGRTLARARVLDVAGWLAVFCGDYERALPLCEEGLSIFQELGLEAESAQCKTALGLTSSVMGRIPQGPQLLEEALERLRRAGDRHRTAIALISMGEVARALGNKVEARSRYEQAMVLLQEMGNTYWPGLLMQNLAHFSLHDGDWRKAAELLARTLELGLEFNYPMAVNLYVAAMGGVAVVRGKPEEGARLFGAVDALLKSLGASFEPTDQAELEHHQRTAREQLGQDAFEAAWKEGAAWSREQAIAATLRLRG
jgi:predicted ATPase/class 3 adenylate cyclase